MTDENLNDVEMFSKVMVSPTLSLPELLSTVSWAKHAAGSRFQRQNLFVLRQNIVFNQSEPQLYLFMVKTRLKNCFFGTEMGVFGKQSRMNNNLERGRLWRA